MSKKAIQISGEIATETTKAIITSGVGLVLAAILPETIPFWLTALGITGKVTLNVIGEKIKELRIKNDLTQEKLAEKTSLSTRYISQLERGLAFGSASTIVNLCKTLNISPDFLFIIAIITFAFDYSKIRIISIILGVIFPVIKSVMK